MNIFIPVGSSKSKNPFVQELVRSLQCAGCLVGTGSIWDLSVNDEWEIILIQWPERLVEEFPLKLEYFISLKKKLNELRRVKTLVATIHNVRPHKYKSDIYVRLYSLVLKSIHGVVHMGSASVTIISSIYESEVDGKPLAVIPHGNYCLFGEAVDKLKAKKLLGVRDSEVVLVIGSIRSYAEFKLLIRAVIACKRVGLKVLYRAEMSFSTHSFKAFPAIMYRLVDEIVMIPLKTALAFMPNLIYRPGPVRFADMHLLMSGVDIVFIPRLDCLNSGNVLLAFTYGCVALGPDVGNVGDLLRSTGNVVFDVDRVGEQLPECFVDSVELVRKGVGKKNKDAATSMYSWEQIGRMYCDFLEGITKKSVVAKQYK